MEDCKSTTEEKKELIIAALQAYKLEKARILAKCIEDGKVSINGCTTYTSETDDALMKLYDIVRPASPYEARKLIKRGITIIDAEKQAIRSHHNVGMRFRERLHLALGDEDQRIDKTSERERIQHQLNIYEAKVRIYQRRLEDLER